MVRLSFIISLALAAQGLHAAPSESRDQVESRAGDASRLAQDGIAGYPVLRLDKRAEGAEGAEGEESCEPEGVTNGTTGGQDNQSKRPIPTGFPTQDEEAKFQKDRQRGKTKHKDAEAQRAQEKSDQDAARETAKQAAIEKDAKDAEARKKAEEEERKRKEERKKDFEKAEKETEKKKATGNQDANKNAQKIVDDGQKNCKEGGSEIGCNKPLPTVNATCSN